MIREHLRILLPVLSLAILLGAVFYLQPRAMSYFGLNLLFNLAIPVALATVAQMMILMVNDIDLSIGTFVSFTACVTATLVQDTPVLGYAVLLVAIAAYAGMGAIIHIRGLPAIVVTLGMSFVWGGIAVMLLPSPGGSSPVWLRSLMTLKPPLVPLAVVAPAVIGLATHLLIKRSSLGVLLQGVGGNERAMERSGWSVVRLKAIAYAIAGLFGVLAGMALVGLTTSADANIALRYTLLSIAGVILGGGEFTGGRVSPVGAVIGALTLTLAASFLSFLRLSPDWQIGAQGAILILVLVVRLLVIRQGTHEMATTQGAPMQRIGTAVGFMGTLVRRPWIWAYLAAAAAFAAIMFASGGQGAGSLVYATLTFASFSAIVGLGQMFVITLGPGNVDLSIPATMTLAGTLALKFMENDSTLILPGLLVALGVGLGCGVFNFALILVLRIPPIIATLSSSFLFQSLAIWSNRGLRIKPPEPLAEFTTSGTLGMPNVAVVAILLGISGWIMLERSIAGRWVTAIGQNLRAARLGGVPVHAVRFGVYAGSAILAATTGFLLASFSGGANLNMGAEFMLMSIAVVVIGGCSIAGGNSNIPGIGGAALFMFLIVSMLNSYGLDAGVRLVLTGFIIVAVVIAASRRSHSA